MTAKKRKFGFNQISVILTGFLAIFFLYAFLRGGDNDKWEKEFKNTKPSSNVVSVKKSWGVPDEEYPSKNGDSLIFDYDKGNGYRFIFDRKTNLLIKKSHQ